MVTEEQIASVAVGHQIQFYSQEYNGFHIGHVVRVTEKTLECKIQRGLRWHDVTVRKSVVKGVFQNPSPPEIQAWLEAEALSAQQEQERALRKAERDARKAEVDAKAAEVRARRSAREKAKKDAEAAAKAAKRAKARQKKDEEAAAAAKKAAKEAARAEVENAKVARAEKKAARQAWKQLVTEQKSRSRQSMVECMTA